MAKRNPTSVFGGRHEPVSVAALGKHPGWEDHIKDIPGVPERLLEIERQLITEGIGGAIANESWKKLKEAGKLREFGHVFVWRTPSDVVVGRLWPSSDAKKRHEYPMVVCAQCVGVPFEWAMSDALARLGELERQCRSTTSASAVRSCVEQATNDLRASAPASAGSGDPRPDAGILSKVASRPEMAGEGLARFMYQFEEELSGFTQPDLAARIARRADETRAQHLRVPACGSNAGEAASLWLTYFLSKLDRNATIVLFMPLADAGSLGVNWVDVVVGEPTPAQVYALRAGPEALPLAVDIPYSLDDSFRRRVEAIRAGGATPARAEGRGNAGPATSESKAPGRKGSKTPLIAGAASVIVVAGVVAGILAARGGGGGGGPGPGPGPGPVVGRSLDARMVEWCERFESSGLASFATSGSGEATRSLRTDAYLASCLIDRLESLNPRALLDTRDQGRTPSELAASPPDAWLATSAVARASEASGAIKGLPALVRAWPLLGDAGRHAAVIRARGWSVAADELDAALSRATTELDAGRIPSPEALVALRESEARAGGVLAEAERAGAFVRAAAGKPSLEPIAATFEAGLAGLGASASLERVAIGLSAAAEASERAARFVDASWSGVDAARLAGEGEVHRAMAAGDASPEMLARWTSEAESFVRLSDATNPARARASRMAAAEARARTLVEGVNAIDEARGVGIADRLAEASREWAALVDTTALVRDRDDLADRVSALEGEYEAIAREGERLAGELGSEKWTPIRRSLQELAGLNDAVAGEVAINARWREIRAQALGSALTDPDTLRVDPDRAERVVSELRKFKAELEALASRLSIAGSAGPGAGIDAGIAGDLQKGLAGQREKALAAIVAGAQWDGREVRWNVERRDAEAAALSASMEEVRALAASLSAALAHLDSGRGLADAFPGGDSVGTSLDELARHPLLASPGASVAGVFERVARLRAIEALDRAGLASLAAAPSELKPEQAAAVWRRLGGLDWPRSSDELAVERSLRARLAGAGWLGPEVEVEGKARWIRFMESAGDEANVRAGLEAMAAFGIGSLDALRGRARFNAELTVVRAAVGSAPVASEDARRLAGALAIAAPAWMEEMPAGVRDQARAIVDAIAGADPAASDAPPDVSMGPGRTGRWTQTPGESDRVVVFQGTIRGQAHTLTFIRVEPEGSPAAYVGRDELPVGLFIDLVAESKASGVLAPLLEVKPGSADERDDPRVWSWQSGGAIGVAKAWVDDPSAAVVPSTFEPVTPPNRATPVVHVSPPAAQAVAMLAGCRLPTTGEWMAAWDLARAGESATAHASASGANLLDARWLKQRDYAEAKSKPALDWGRFTGSDVANDSTLGEDADDGLIFFRGAGEGDGMFRNILGNVAEFVLTDAGLAEGLDPVRAPGEAAAAASAVPASAWGVVGGSAFWPGAAPIDRVQAVDPGDVKARRGYNDVGLRLAFTAPRPVIAGGVPLSRVVKEARLLGP